MEYLDITDLHGNLLGEKKPREEIHANGDWHNVVHIHVYTKIRNETNILVHLRSKTKDLSPNKWDTRFGGHVKSGETVEETVLKEIREELGINVSISDLIKGETYSWDTMPNREVVHTFFYNFEGDIDGLRFNDGEVQEIKWMSISEIQNSMTQTPNQWVMEGDLANFEKVVSPIKNQIE